MYESYSDFTNDVLILNPFKVLCIIRPIFLTLSLIVRHVLYMRREKEIGDGEDYVYVYYSPNDKKLATFEGRDRWECKIGFPSTDPI